MILTSPSFVHEGVIPPEYTCDGQDISPPLRIQGTPHHAKALALICEDPDVPKTLRADGLYIHWIVFNIPPSIQEIDRGTKAIGIDGTNTAERLGYTGPCPPDREHRYYFTLYALDQMLPLEKGASKQQVLAAMEGHILAEATLMGKYNRQQNVSKC